MEVVTKKNKNTELALKLLKECMFCSVLDTKDYVGVLGFCLALNKQEGELSSSTNLRLLFKSKTLHFNDYFSKDIPVLLFATIGSILKEESEIDYQELYEEIIFIALKDFRGAYRLLDTEIPKEVSLFITELNGGFNGLDVYIPIAGGASFCLADNNSRTFGYEADVHVWLIGFFRLMFRGMEVDSYINKDFLDLERDNVVKYDAILVTLPWVRYVERIIKSSLLFENYQHTDSRTYAIEHALMNMKEGGVSYIFVHSSFLNNNETFFTLLLKHKYLQMVILFPEEIWNKAYYKEFDAIIVLKKNETGKVCFIDATSFLRKIGDVAFKLANKELLYAINKKDDKYFRNIHEDDIIVNDRCLYPKLYFTIQLIHREMPSCQYLKIREFLRPIENSVILDYRDFENEYRANHAKVVEPKELIPQKFSYEYSFSAFDYIKPSHGNVYKILDKNVILMPKFERYIGNPMLYVNKVNEDVLVPDSVKVFDYDSSIIDPLYFCHEFQQVYIQKKLSDNKMFNYPIFNFDEILDIKMLVPSIEVQKAVYQEEKRAYHLSKLQELGFEKILEKERKAYMDDLDCKQHNIGQILERISSGADLILIEIKESKRLDDEIIRKMESHIENIELLSDKIKQLTTPCSIAKGEDIDLRKRIYDYASTEKYEVIYDVSDLERMGHDYAIVSIGKDNFDVIMENILNNACKHGFIKEEKHIVKIKLSFDVNCNEYILEISNNGKAMPEHMDTYRYGIRGEKGGPTANTGLGGYQIRTIVEHFKGSYEVVNDPSSVFPVKIIIKLPKYIK